MRQLVIAAVLLGALAAPDLARAEIDFEGDRPRVFSIQERPYRLRHEFQLGVGVLPLDAFYVGVTAQASYTFHFTDFWAWEIASGNYSMNFNTGLQGNLKDEYGVVPVREGGERIKTFATTGVVVKPLFGKLALLNSSAVLSETFFVAGLGPMLKGEYWRPTGVVGVGFRFWSGRSLSWRLDLRDYLVFSNAVPENTLSIMLSAAFNYREADTVVTP